ncbi:hypothetical protein DTL42_13500 [Bremerella cremea]|uniref:Uncharacterized protein n=1 Tax=Bremerella cremea TaxID=1031537 RepID=A0A368KQG1_9BACT|nr:hypothetical protein [Bremerella cremea]RCS48295.1 hypothetical protein DTL42_13500 [Bremerella cremea]
MENRWLFQRAVSRDPLSLLYFQSNLYSYADSQPVVRLDPYGLYSPFDNADTVPFADYFIWLIEEIEQHKGRKLSFSETKVIGETLQQGCVGVVGTQLGYKNNEWTKKLTHCYKDVGAAIKKSTAMQKDNTCCPKGEKNIAGKPASPRIVWIQFSNDANTPIPEKDGVYDLSGDPVYKEIDTHVGGKDTGPNFDYKNWEGFWKKWLGANHGGVGMEVNVCNSLRAAIDEGERVGLESSFYCIVCESEMK